MLADAFSLKELGTRVSNMQSDQAALTRYDHQRLTAGEQLKQAVRASGSTRRSLRDLLSESWIQPKIFEAKVNTKSSTKLTKCI